MRIYKEILNKFNISSNKFTNKQLNEVMLWISTLDSSSSDYVKILHNEYSFERMHNFAKDWFNKSNKEHSYINCIYQEDNYKIWQLTEDNDLITEGILLNNCLKSKHEAIGYPPSEIYVLKSPKNKTVAMLRIRENILLEVKGYSNKKINPKYRTLFLNLIKKNKLKLNYGFFDDLFLIKDLNGIHDAFNTPKELNFNNTIAADFYDFSKFPLSILPNIKLQRLYLLNNKIVKTIKRIDANDVYMTKLDLDNLIIKCNILDINLSTITNICFLNIPSTIKIENCNVQNITYDFGFLYKLFNFKKIKEFKNQIHKIKGSNE